MQREFKKWIKKAKCNRDFNCDSQYSFIIKNQFFDSQFPKKVPQHNSFYYDFKKKTNNDNTPMQDDKAESSKKCYHDYRLKSRIPQMDRKRTVRIPIDTRFNTI